MDNSLLVQGTRTVFNVAKQTLNGSMIGTIVLNIVFKGAFNLILALINTLQMILHFPIQRI